ncbi:hypothetical protein TNIN_212261 [Trichonephila inaurata madagascariensis]|uniref:Uncharacterized protein n=1 Tax=Trichonephila inaurata madagascariensis TaxID=2747483 RepID=A0A8X6X4P8_9ARAC|nr:hypothetical protein TNIN_212261 [Trichonephila inaurata madagascariensis]
MICTDPDAGSTTDSINILRGPDASVSLSGVRSRILISESLIYRPDSPGIKSGNASPLQMSSSTLFSRLPSNPIKHQLPLTRLVTGCITKVGLVVTQETSASHVTLSFQEDHSLLGLGAGSENRLERTSPPELSPEGGLNFGISVEARMQRFW